MTNWGKFYADQRASQPREGETQAEAYERAAGREGESTSERYQRHTRNFVAAALLILVAVVVALGIAGASLAVGGW